MRHLATELATGYVSLVVDTRDIPGQLRNAFGDAGSAAGRTAGDNAVSGILGGLKGMGAAGIGAAVGGAFAAAGLGAAKLFMSQLENGMQQQKVLGMTQARLGADDATMARLGRAASKAYTNAFGESIESNLDAARRAIQAGLLSTDDSSTTTTKVIEQLNTVTDLLGEDLPKVARAAGQAIKTGLVKDSTEAFDLLVAGERANLNVSEDMLDSVIEYGTQFRKLGLSGQEAFGLMSQAANSGARDSDIAADAIKEFSIRVIDGSKSTTEAFETLGFGAEEMVEKISQGGPVARAAVGDLLTKIREIEDPAERGQIALALFGTQAEDLGGALDAMNLDTAVTALGKVEGAAESAANAMGGPAASLDSAKRSIEVSTDQIALALANAYGPELAKVADWVSTHQPEILGFLGDFADAALMTGEVLGGMAYWALKAGEGITMGIGAAIGNVLEPIGNAALAVGKLTGNDKLTEFGNSLRDANDGFGDFAATLGSMADAVQTGVDKLGGLRESVGLNIDQMQQAALVTRALGAEVEAVPSEKGITINSNTPEQTAALEALGLKVTALPDGRFEVTAGTDAAKASLEAFIAANQGRKIPIEVTTNLAQVEANLNALNSRMQQQAAATTPDNPYVHYATGTDRRGVIPRLAGGGRAGRTADGLLFGPGNGTSDSILGIGYDGVPTALVGTGEGVVKYSAMQRGGGDLVQALNRGWVPSVEFLRGLTGLAGGGVVPGKAFAQSMDPAVYEMGGFSTSSIDCSGMVAATINDAMGLDPFSSRMSTMSEGEWLAARGGKSGLGGAGDISVGWYDNGGGPFGHTALTLGDGTNVESNGSEGVVVGGPVGADDPMFTNRMHIPAALLRGGDLGGGAGGTGAGGTGGTGAGGGGASGGGAGGGGAGLGGSNSGGVTIGGVDIPAGVTPVWIVGTSGSSTNVAASDTSTVAPDVTTSTSSSSTSGVQTLEEAWNTGLGRFGDVGTAFFEGQVDDALGTVGLSRSGGAIQTLVSTIYDKVTAAIQDELNKRNVNQASAISQFGGSR